MAAPLRRWISAAGEQNPAYQARFESFRTSVGGPLTRIRAAIYSTQASQILWV